MSVGWALSLSSSCWSVKLLSGEVGAGGGAVGAKVASAAGAEVGAGEGSGVGEVEVLGPQAANRKRELTGMRRRASLFMRFTFWEH